MFRLLIFREDDQHFICLKLRVELQAPASGRMANCLARQTQPRPSEGKPLLLPISDIQPHNQLGQRITKLSEMSPTEGIQEQHSTSSHAVTNTR